MRIEPLHFRPEKAETGRRAHFGVCPLLRDEPTFPPGAGPLQALVAELRVEALHKAVLHRLARRDVVPCDPVLRRPAEHCVAGQLRAAALAEPALAHAPLSTDRFNYHVEGIPGSRSPSEKIDLLLLFLAKPAWAQLAHPHSLDNGQSRGYQTSCTFLLRGKTGYL
jgi:hypothetical protein